MVVTAERARVDDKALIHTCFLLAPRFTLLPFAGFIELLRHAADVADRSRQVYCKWSIMTRDGQPAVSSCGAKISASPGHSPRGGYDYIIVVGGILPDCLDVGEEVDAFLHDGRGRGAGNDSRRPLHWRIHSGECKFYVRPEVLRASDSQAGS